MLKPKEFHLLLIFPLVVDSHKLTMMQLLPLLLLVLQLLLLQIMIMLMLVTTHQPVPQLLSLLLLLIRTMLEHHTPIMVHVVISMVQVHQLPQPGLDHHLPPTPSLVHQWLPHTYVVLLPKLYPKIQEILQLKLPKLSLITLQLVKSLVTKLTLQI